MVPGGQVPGYDCLCDGDQLMVVTVLLDGLTFGGRVWRAGELVDTDKIHGFPVHALAPGWCDKLGRAWFKPVESQPNEHGPEPQKEGLQEKKAFACKNCGKVYKSVEWLKKHEAACGG